MRRFNAPILILVFIAGCVQTHTINGPPGTDLEVPFTIAQADVQRINAATRGHKVVVHLRDGSSFKAKHVEVTSASLLWGEDKPLTHEVALSEVADLRVSAYHAGAWIGVGLLAGALIGAGIGLASGDDTCPPDTICLLPLTADDKAVLGAIGFGLTGGLIGAVQSATGHQRFVFGPKGKVARAGH